MSRLLHDLGTIVALLLAVASWYQSQLIQLWHIEGLLWGDEELDLSRRS